MNVIVTGSNGFIGKHVCKYFKEKGLYVVGVGRHEQSMIDVDEYVCCDLSTDEAKKICDKVRVKVDAVVHLAADMRHEPYTVDVTTTNCGGTQRLLEMCEEKQVGVFLQLSSLPVIGKPNQHPIMENHSIKPPTVYHVTKHTQELLANYADYTFGLRTASFRISAPVGIGMNPKTIFPVFVHKALNNENIVLSGKGTRKQTYVHVRDIAQALYKALFNDAHGVYNLSSNNLLSNYELALKCKEVLGSDSEIQFSGKEDYMDDYCWDVSLDRIKSDIGYNPEVGIEEAINELADYIRKTEV